MTSKRSSKPVAVREGDVFEISAPDGKLGFGQVIVSGKILYVVFFEDLYSEVPDLDDLIKSKLLLVGWTVDALIFHGRWKIVGNRPPDSERVPFPSYKVLMRGKVHVHDFRGKELRLADPAELELLENKTTVAPIRYQKAFLAHHGFEKWEADYERLTVAYAQRRVVPV